tara:strand:- start:4454 stop:4711 length:258 start_codon:yes stop_codon:yes gene_type:complete
MKLINLDRVNLFIDENEYEHYELMAYTKQANKNGFDLSGFYELHKLEDIKSVCARIVREVSDLHHVDIKLTSEDSDFDQVTIYKQ